MVDCWFATCSIQMVFQYGMVDCWILLVGVDCVHVWIPRGTFVHNVPSTWNVKADPNSWFPFQIREIKLQRKNDNEGTKYRGRSKRKSQKCYPQRNCFYGKGRPHVQSKVYATTSLLGESVVRRETNYNWFGFSWSCCWPRTTKLLWDSCSFVFVFPSGIVLSRSQKSVCLHALLLLYLGNDLHGDW